MASEAVTHNMNMRIQELYTMNVDGKINFCTCYCFSSLMPIERAFVRITSLENITHTLLDFWVYFGNHIEPPNNENFGERDDY